MRASIATEITISKADEGWDSLCLDSQACGFRV